MDINKLAKLSCLKIDDKDQQFFINSLSDVFKMMDQISNLNTNTINDNLLSCEKNNSLNIHEENKDVFKKDQTIIDRNISYAGIGLENGVFLAPKVIRKG